MKNEALTIGTVTVEPGHRRRIELPVARLFTQTSVSLPVEVINGVKGGPCLWLCAALHGDELNGVEIIHRVLTRLQPTRLAGCLVAVPIVNVFGFIHRTRDLPDGRDLNRHFPGSASGSLASRVARLFMTQVVARCDYGIDIHTAAGHRTNLPQVRGNLVDARTRRLAETFGAPCMIHGQAPRGSLRAVCADWKIPMIVYEAGEPCRFNRRAITLGVQGVLRVMAGLGMIARRRPPRHRSIEATRRTWLRAPRAGILRLTVRLGQRVRQGQSVGDIHDAFGDQHTNLCAPAAGLVIGHTHHPLVNQGDAIIHLATQIKTHPA